MISPLEQFFQANFLVRDGATVTFEAVQDNALVHFADHEPQKPLKPTKTEEKLERCKARSRQRRREQQSERRKARLARAQEQEDMNQRRWLRGDGPSPEITQRKASETIHLGLCESRRNSTPKPPRRRQSSDLIDIPPGAFDERTRPRLPRRRNSPIFDANDMPQFDELALNALAA